MEKPTIALCLVAKDKEKQIRTALESTKAVFDVYCLQDTGSSDKTIQVFEDYCKRNNKQFHISAKSVGKDYKSVEVDGRLILGDFAQARNDSFALIPESADYAFWIDTDDELMYPEDIPHMAVYAQEKGVDAIFMVYDYANVDTKLNPLSQQRERLINLKKKGHWQNRVHENYAFDEPVTILLPEQLQKLGFRSWIKHRRIAADSAATNRRNHLIMKAQLEEEGLDKFSDEMLSHLAYDHWEHQELEDSIKYYDLLLGRYEGKQMNSESIYYTVIRVAQAYYKQGKLEDAIKYCFRAIVTMPQMADGYILMASCFADVGRWDEAEKYATKVLELGRPQTTAPINDYEYFVIPRKILMQTALNKRDYKRALQLSTELINLMPEDAGIKQEYYTILNEQRNDAAILAIGELSRHYQSKGTKDVLDRVLPTIPLELLDNDIVRSKVGELKSDQNRKLQSVKFPEGYSKTIVIWAGQGYEHWDGESDITKGIGGSEGMCIQLSRELAALGNKVYVYNDCGESDGKTFDGVMYIDFRKWSPKIKADIFVSLRDPAIFRQLNKATKQYLWLHDTDYGNQDLIDMYAPNKIIVLTDFHREVIKQNHGVMDHTQYYVTRNALNKYALEFADKNAGKRDPYKLIYASSYDRGLDNLLRFWPTIKAAVPEATLDIYYGTVTMDRMIQMHAQRGNMQLANAMQQFKSSIIEQIAKLDGVRELGRISQNELYKKFKEASIWAYPTKFQEISCITAMQAQALGAVPVCTPVAALNETVNSIYGGIKAEMGNFADSVIYLLKNQVELEERRAKMMGWARKEYDIISLAQEWDTFFNND